MVPNVPASISCLATRYQGCQRKFSCTTRVTPALDAIASASRASAKLVVNGFWQIIGMPRIAQARIIDRCVSGGVTMSTRSGRTASSIASTSS